MLAGALFVILCLTLPRPALAAKCAYEWSAPECDDGKYWNGYWSKLDTIFVPGYITLDTLFTPAPLYARGRATFYSPVTMQATADYMELDLEGYVDGISLMSPADVGLKVWIRPEGERWEGPYLVVDCAMRGDQWPIIVNRLEIAEVSWKTARRWGMVESNGKINQYVIEVEVSKVRPRYLGDLDPVDFVEWYKSIVEFVNPWGYWSLSKLWLGDSTWLVDGRIRTFTQPRPEWLSIWRRTR